MGGKRMFCQGILLLGSLLFFLPFVAVSCEGARVAQLTGTQLVTGTQIQTPAVLGSATVQIVPSQPILGGALALGVLALLLGFTYRNPIARAVAAASSLLALAAMLVFQYQGAQRLAGMQLNPFTVSMEPAYWGAAACYLLGFLLNLGAPAPVRADAPAAAAPKPEPPCALCGAPRQPGMPFCASCGQRLDAKP